MGEVRIDMSGRIHCPPLSALPIHGDLFVEQDWAE